MFMECFLSQALSKCYVVTHLTIPFWCRHNCHLHLQMRHLRRRWPVKLYSSKVVVGRHPQVSAWPLPHCLPQGSVPLMEGPEHLCIKEAPTWRCLSAEHCPACQRQRAPLPVRGEGRKDSLQVQKAGRMVWPCRFFLWESAAMRSFATTTLSPLGFLKLCPSCKQNPCLWLSVGHVSPQRGSYLKKGQNRCTWNSSSIKLFLIVNVTILSLQGTVYFPGTSSGSSSR